MECLNILHDVFLININRIPNQFICKNRVAVTFKHKSAFLSNLLIPCSTVRFLLLEKASAQCFIVLVCDDVCHSADLCGFQWQGCLDGGSSLHRSPEIIMEICPHPSLDESPLIIFSEKSMTFWSLSQLQTGWRGCTLEAWYFGFPQQQQWTQDSTIMKRNVATNRMSTKKAPSSRGLACGRPCSLVHTF